MEWASGATDMKFYHAYNSMPQVQNSVIDFDVKNINKILSKKCSLSGETVARKVNKHYKESLRHIQRSFGSKHIDDFQRYTWGMVLTADLGLLADKLEALIQFYCRKTYPRFALSDYEKILTSHSSFRKFK
jgi:hypothetical protein